MSFRAAVLFGLAIAVPAAAQTYVVRKLAPEPGTTVHIARQALAGQTVRVWYATMLNADCTPSGTMTTTVIESPRKGSVEISDKPVMPNFIAPNPRVVCDKVPSPGKQAFYTAPADFHGHDRIVLQNATSDGMVRRIVIDVKVV